MVKDRDLVPIPLKVWVFKITVILLHECIEGQDALHCVPGKQLYPHADRERLPVWSKCDRPKVVPEAPSEQVLVDRVLAGETLETIGYHDNNRLRCFQPQ